MSDLARPCTVLAGPCADGLYLGLRHVLQFIQTKQSMLGGDLIVGSVLTRATDSPLAMGDVPYHAVP